MTIKLDPKKTYTASEVADMLAEANSRPVTVKLNPTGTISVTGVGRWPVSLYKSQWQRVLAPDTVRQITAAMAVAPDKPRG